MGKLINLEPERVFYYFEQICSIPHGSHNTEKISRYCEKCGEKYGSFVSRDKFNNVIIKKPASKGCEEAPPVIVQAHMDMVCQKDSEIEIDFKKDAIILEVEGDAISAKHTTLGGDDGIGVACILALLESRTIVHPPLEFVLTADEETGMIGAAALDASCLMGKRMLNLDCEGEGVITAGCAGVIAFKGTIPIFYESFCGSKAVRIVIQGLHGGHSGDCIHKGYVNANKLMGRILSELESDYEIRVAKIFGGTADNAIPRSSEAVVLISSNMLSDFLRSFSDGTEKIYSELSGREPKLMISCEQTDEGELALTEESSKRVVFLLNQIPDGVCRMNQHIPDTVETSLNIGIICLEENAFVIRSLIRSSRQTAMEAVKNKLCQLLEYLGGNSVVESSCPPWDYIEKSEFRGLICQAIKQVLHKEPVVEVIHAALECGLITNKLSELDAAAIGPNLYDIHTTAESLSISSVGKLWEIILCILEYAAKK